MGVGTSRATTKYMIDGVLRNATLWKTDRSPSCRAVMMTLDALNISVYEVDVDVDSEHKNPDIIVVNQKRSLHSLADVNCMNNLQKLPILKDKDLVISDSHAISTYLASKFCDTEVLLPRDPGQRALIDQMMHYNSGVLAPKYRSAAYPILFEDCTHVMPHHVSEIESTYADLERMLLGRSWFTNNTWPMLSDICFCATVSTLNVMVPIDKMRFPRLHGWLNRMASEPYYITGNAKGLTEFTRRMNSGFDSIIGEKKFKCPKTSTKRRSLTQPQANV